MTRKIRLFAYALSLTLTIFSNNIVSIKAYTDTIIEPDVACLPGIGCLVDEYDDYANPVKFPVVQYTQKITDPNPITDPDYKLIYMHMGAQASHCATSLYYGDLGCVEKSEVSL